MTATSGWISVEERMPGDGDKGWMQIVDHGVRVPGFWHPGEQGWSGADDAGSTLTGVTAWQLFASLPPDPADEELEGIVRTEVMRYARWWDSSRTADGDNPGRGNEIRREIVAEIKAWRDKHKEKQT